MIDHTKTALKGLLTALYGLIALSSPVRSLVGLSFLAFTAHLLQGLLAVKRGEAWNWSKFLRGVFGEVGVYFAIYWGLTLTGTDIGDMVVQGAFFALALVETYVIVEAAVELKLMPKLLLNLFRAKLKQHGVETSDTAGAAVGGVQS